MTPDDLEEWLTVAPWLVAVILVVLALTWFVRKALPVLRKGGHLIDDLVGEPVRPGVMGRPGLMERMQSVEHEVRPNTGTSLNDSVRRTEAHLREVDEKIDRALAWQRTHEEKSDAIVARVDKIEKEIE